ncbi:DapH/DapD/GlmU-related protein [Methanolobus profundi]|uniref:Serine O-acetyltransferase n=1 Tax=Methanolobus profundi TaxID=487685 RepID=A0A1I4RVI2_9EURY|nr:DapH/DapD/GlmU-related protein [Methanolobus profundi]SFM56258.1 serine O-acetyltransferase [Methanolobus profundi]
MLIIVDLIVRLNGGFFELKNKINSTNHLLVKKIYLLLYVLYLKSNCSFIGYNSIFAATPTLPHGINGIFISGNAVIGKNCVIFQNTTIGSNTLPDSKGLGSPTIGDNCYIGAGAVIIGNINIGNNCRIGANTTVFQDIPDNSVVISSKPLIIQKDNLNNHFYSKHGNKWVYCEENTFIPENDVDILNKLNNAFK